MTVLAPPIVKGPVVRTSPSLRVDGVLAGASVEVVADDGTGHADGTAVRNGTVWLQVTVPLQEGSLLFARQELAGTPSGLSFHGTPVVPLPANLPRPVFEAVLNQCSDAALLSGLVPGAEVAVRRGATILGQATVERTRQWISLGVAPNVGETLAAQQSLAGLATSPVAFSEPVTSINIEMEVAAPQVAGPLTACQPEVAFVGVVPSAVVIADADDGSSTSWRAPGPSFRGLFDVPLAEGDVTLRQRLTGCEFDSETRVVPVGPEVKPPAPRPWAFCPESRRIAVEGLEAGAIVDFSTASWDNAIGGWGPETPLMRAGAAGGLQEFDLPHVVGGGPGPIINIFVRQTRCTLASDPGFAREYIRPGEPGGIAPTAQPRIVAPVYTCAQTVRVDPSGWGLGVLRSSRNGAQLADAFSPVVGVPAVVALWFPLAAGDELVVDYFGCDAPDRTAPPVAVKAVPDPLGDLTIVPPLPGDTDLIVSGALPGARVVALVDGHVRSARTTIDGSASLPLFTPLTEGQRVWAYQRLCGSKGNDEDSVPVQRGRLSVTVTPTSVAEGTSDAFTVTTTRVDTGATVAGLPVRLVGAPVGVTGTPFGWSAGTAGNVAGSVVGGSRYTDAAFSITVARQPPPPTGATLTLQLGGFGGYGSPIAVNKVTWKVQPTWAAAAISQSGTTATVTLPPPPAGTVNPGVAIYLDEFEATRVDQGILFKLWPDALAPLTIVALTQPSFHVGVVIWRTEFLPIYDGQGQIVDYRWFAYIRWQGTT